MEGTNVLLELERHEQMIKILERDIRDLKSIQNEIRTMNESLVTLANELKHTNDHLERHEMRIDAIENMPKQRLSQIITAIISALAGGLISTILSQILLK